MSSQEAQQQEESGSVPGSSKLERAGSKSFKLVASPSGANLFVQAQDYDPLAPHRKHDQAHDQGEGLGYVLWGWCLSWCCCGRAAVKEPPEPAATADRHYSLPQSESMLNLLTYKAQ